ncbi:hypothetical protein ANCDUO_04313 [Ancylostoma duodenale]|uniref:Peptidase aspartic putative domain-containing protein n=1 Tax=Ancylostoma duodenale TaxID=51022 RepID=A0A0C2H1G1_9BILA|nr:hypothetical protein ANCDUO_04313 [Ancylostoma duodenale]
MSTSADVQLVDLNGKTLNFTMNTKERLIAPHNTAPVTKEDALAILSLGIEVHPVRSTEVTPEILLGIDYFWDVVSREPSKVLPSGMLWELDAIGITDNPDPVRDEEESERVIKQFFDTVRELDGMLFVQFPWKVKHPRLADNKQLAFKHLQSQYKSLQNKPELWASYAKTFEDQIAAGIIEEVEEDVFDDPRVYYIPHQAVVKESSTTAVRVVFDASSHYKGAASLNDCLHQGPPILPNLCGLLLRARTFPFLLIADVEKAFHQIRLQVNQRDATRF